jgi:endonuclease YncB( thermonuclease family)
MKQLPLSGLFRKKILLILLAICIVLALVSVAFIKLNGVWKVSSAERVESSLLASNDPNNPVSMQETPADDPVQGIEPSATLLDTPQDEEVTPTEGKYAFDEALCISEDTEYQVASVIEALDANKLSVSIDGQLSTVIYLGIDTHDLNEELREQARSANQALVGQTVALVKDVSDVDGAGNLLRYVFTDKVFINMHMIEEGLAIPIDTPPDEGCAQDFLEAQAKARSQEIGIWERLKPENWRDWPVVPEISENALDIYLRGLNAGTDPKLFSIIADCQSIPGGILFRRINWDDFSLSAEYDYLRPTIENFRSIWSRQPITVDGGFIPASMFSTYWTDTERCDPIETPLECEFRVNNMSILLISIGTDQKPGTGDDFDHYMRKIVEFSIERNVLPILATIVYATEEGFPLNYIMAQIAYDYGIPLWNFWAAVQELPNHGLKEDNFHINAEAFEIKRITGIQVLHAVLTAAQQ